MGATSEEDGTSSSDGDIREEENKDDNDVEHELETASSTSWSHPSSRTTTPAFGTTTTASLIDEFVSASAVRYHNDVLPDNSVGVQSRYDSAYIFVWHASDVWWPSI